MGDSNKAPDAVSMEKSDLEEEEEDYAQKCPAESRRENGLHENEQETQASISNSDSESDAFDEEGKITDMVEDVGMLNNDDDDNEEEKDGNEEEGQSRAKRLPRKCVTQLKDSLVDSELEEFLAEEIKAVRKRKRQRPRSRKNGHPPYECEVCSKIFLKLSHLTEHKRIHTGEKPYKCDWCGKCFTQSSHLRTHRLTHYLDRPFKCDKCNKGFCEVAKLRKHKQVHEKKLAQLQGLALSLTKNQAYIAGDEKPFKCTICEKSFSKLSHLNEHERIHTGVRPYECEICLKTFTQVSYIIALCTLFEG